MRINKNEIIKILKKYPDITLEEIRETNDSIEENFCITTCDIKIIEYNKKDNEGCIGEMQSEIFDFINEIKKYDNIYNLKQITYENLDDEYPFYEYFGFSWRL